MRNTYTSYALGLLFFICFTHTHAQPKTWDKRFGGAGYDDLYSMIATSDGGFLLGGYSPSGAEGDKSQTSQGRDDYWVVKIDGSGTKLWDKRFGGAGYDELYSVIATSDGGFLLGGYSDSDAGGDKSEASQGGSDYWVVQIDGSGTKLWDKRFGGAGSDVLYSMIATSDGGFLLGGKSRSGAEGDKSQASQGYYDYWVVKIDGSGTKLWDKRFGGAGSDYLNSMIATSDGGFLLGGYSPSGAEGDKSQASQGRDDYWVVKIDGSGTKLWDKRFGGTSYDYLSSIIATSDGGFLLGGYSYSDAGGDKSQGSQGGSDYWVVQIDGSGIKLWDKRFGGASYDELHSMIATSDGGFLLGGYSYSGAEGDKSQASQGNDDYWVVKIDGSGIKLWDKRFGGAGSDYLNSMIATSDGGFLLGGYSDSDAGGDKSQASQGYFDYWVVKMCGNLTASISPNTPQSVCSGAILALSGSSAGGTSPTYAWSAGGGAFGSNQQNPSLTAPTVGSTTAYTITLITSESGCSATATVRVTVNPVPKISTQPASQTLPELDNLALTVVASNATSYQWQKDNANFGSSSASPSLNLGPATLGMSGTYKVIVSGACGSATSSVAIVTVTPSASFATSNGPVCIGLVIDLKCQNSGTGYTWLGPDGWTSNLKNPSRGSATAVMAGVYSVSVKSGSVVSSATTSVQMVTKNNVSASSNSPVTVGNAIQLSANGGLAFSKTYAWTGSSSFSSTLQNPMRPNAQLTHKGKYIVTFNGACGTATASTSVVVNAATRIASGEDEGEALISIEASPNPSSDVVRVKVKLAKASSLQIDLIDALGRRLESKAWAEAKQVHEFEFTLHDRTEGSYLLRVATNEGLMKTKRLVKQ